MTVANETNVSGPYNGNGVTTIFNYGFRIVDQAHLSVVKTASNGTQTTLSLGTNYTVSGVGNSGGGQITVAPAPAVGETITISRNVPFKQEVDLENQGPYFAETIETALDLAVMRDLQLREQVDGVLIGAREWANNPENQPVTPSSGGNGVDDFSARHWAAKAAAIAAIVNNNLAVENFVGDGTQTTWTLAVSPGSKNNCFVTIDGAPQLRSSYVLGGVGSRDLTFLEAPPNEAAIEVVYGNATSIGTPADGSVTQAKLAFTLTNFMLSLLDDADASAALTTLGVSAFAKTLLDDADAATARATLGAQAADADLSAIAALASAANKLPYATGPGAWALADFTAFARTLVASADALSARKNLGVAIEHPNYVVGRWYSPWPTSLGAGVSWATGNIRLVPFFLRYKVELSDLACWVATAAAGGNVQLALYASDPATKKPTGAALAVTGSISTAATGAVSADITGANVILEPGMYWMAANLDAAAGGVATFRTTGTHGASAWVGSTALATAGNTSNFALNVAQAFGAWPDLTAAAFTEDTTFGNAVVMFKVSAAF